MSKTLSVDLILNSMGFKQGIDQAKAGTEEYASAVKISDTNIKQLNQAMRAAQKETKALAIAFNSLSKAEQESANGRALERQMYDAAEAAAKFKDIAGDTDAMIRAMASDTAGLDALKQGLDIGKSAALGYAGAIAKLTGDEKALKDVIAQVTMVEGFFGAAIKITNALQKQSSIMIGIRRLQHLAAKKAIEAETAATKGATVAQKAFNAVAKANPYVLLGTVILAAAAAITTYMLATKKSAEEEARQQAAVKASEDALEAYKNTLTTTLTTSLTKYKQLQAQWNALKTDHEKTQFVKNKAKEFKDLGEKVDNVNDAERVLKTNADAVVAGLMARAKAAAYAAQAQQYYSKMVEASIKIEELQANRKKDLESITKPATRTVAGSGGNFGYVQTYTVSVEEQQAEVNKKYQKDLDEWNKTQAEFEKKGDELINKSAEILKDIPDVSVTDEKTSKEDKNRIDYALNSLKQLEAELSLLQEKRSKGLLPQMDAKEYLSKVKELKNKITDKKVELGIELPKSNLEKLKDELKDAEAELPFAVSDEDVAQAQAKIKRIKDDIEKEEIRLKIKVDVEAEKAKTDAQAIADIVKNALEEDLEPKWDFSGLPESMEEAANETVSKIKKLGDAIKELQKIRDKSNNKNTKNKANTEINALKKEKKALEDTAESFQKQSDEQKKHNEQLKLNKASYDMIAESASMVGNALRQMGAEEAAVAVEFVANSAKMIMQCIQNIAALQAQAMAAGTASGAALPFPANIAAIASILATIIGIFASLPVFAEGGIVPGNSFTGDKVLARLNSGERVLTAKQNENLEKIANGVAGGINNVYVEGIIKGKDLMLVQKNYNSLAIKSGQQIKI